MTITKSTSTRTSSNRWRCIRLTSTSLHTTCCDTGPTATSSKRENSAEAPFNFDTGITVSNGGLNSPFPDMQKYLCFLLGNPAQKAYDTILKRPSLEEMFAKQLDVASSDSSQLAGSRGTDSIGLGFFRHEEAGRLYIGHGGNQNGFLSHFYLDPRSHAAYLVAFNTDATDKVQNTGKLDLEIRTYLLVRKLTIS